MLAGVLKQITRQMANMTQNQSYSGVGHNVKEAYDAYVPTSYKSKFYLEKLPVPWNVLPRNNAKDSIDIKVIDSIFKNTFKGLEDGSYFMWRPEVINIIHTPNLSVQRKYMFITKFLDRKEARLAAMCIFTTFTASTYVDLIEELELMYGGRNPCFDFVRTKLINGNKLKLPHLTNMHDVRGRIENFIEHCHMHGLSEDIDNKLMLQLVHNKLMNQNQLIGLYTENSVNPFIAKMDTISVIVEWLTRKITAIRYAQERLTKVFDPVVEIKKVNLASAEAIVGQEMAREDLGVDFSSTALLTQFIDDEA
jgi:hypothetical protein